MLMFSWSIIFKKSGAGHRLERGEVMMVAPCYDVDRALLLSRLQKYFLFPHLRHSQNHFA